MTVPRSATSDYALGQFQWAPTRTSHDPFPPFPIESPPSVLPVASSAVWNVPSVSAVLALGVAASPMTAVWDVASPTVATSNVVLPVAIGAIWAAVPVDVVPGPVVVSAAGIASVWLVPPVDVIPGAVVVAPSVAMAVWVCAEVPVSIGSLSAAFLAGDRRQLAGARPRRW